MKVSNIYIYFKTFAATWRKLMSLFWFKEIFFCFILLCRKLSCSRRWGNVNHPALEMILVQLQFKISKPARIRTDCSWIQSVVQFLYRLFLGFKLLTSSPSAAHTAASDLCRLVSDQPFEFVPMSCARVWLHFFPPSALLPTLKFKPLS